MKRLLIHFRFLIVTALALAIAAASGQTPVSNAARQKVNTIIQPNGTRAITATGLNDVLNKILDAVDSGSAATLPRLATTALSGTASGNTYSLHWSRVPDAYHYQLQSSSSSGFVNASLLLDTRDTFTTVTLSGTTYLRLRAQGFAKDNALWSDAYTAGNTSPPQQLGNIEFLSVTGTTDNTISLAWASIPNTETYVLQRSTASDFATIGAVNNIGAPQTSYTATGLISGTHYYFRIRATAAGYTPGGYAYADATTTAPANNATISYWYADANPYIDDNTAPTPNGTISTITTPHNTAISFLWPATANGRYLVWKVPDTESIKTTWDNGQLNNGQIPDVALRASFAVGGYRYYITRSSAGFSFDPSIAITLQ